MDLILSCYDAFNRRDLAAVLNRMDPDVDFQTTVEAHRGHDGVAEWIRRADEIFDSFAMTVEEVIDLHDRIVVVVHEQAEGKGSGVEIDQRLTHVWTVHDGHALSLQAFTERAAALKAVGLSE